VAATSLETAADNAVRALLTAEGGAAANWPEPGDFGQRVSIEVNPATQTVIMAWSREATGC